MRPADLPQTYLCIENGPGQRHDALSSPFVSVFHSFLPRGSPHTPVASGPLTQTYMVLLQKWRRAGLLLAERFPRRTEHAAYPPALAAILPGVEHESYIEGDTVQILRVAHGSRQWPPGE